MKSYQESRRINTILVYAMLGAGAVLMIFPFLWMLLSALKPKTEIRTATPSLLIHAPTLENFKRVLVDVGFLQYIKNSFFGMCSLYDHSCHGRIRPEPVL